VKTIFKRLKAKVPQNAIILAAGFGLRMAPINMDAPKAMLKVNGEPLIERIIKQLHEVGIYEIYVVVGFKKEEFEYLIDKYDVELIQNPEYATKNNMYSLKLALDHLSNSYIIPCDIWCAKNPFRRYELYSWYMVSDLIDDSSCVRVNRKLELVSVTDCVGGNSMIGICYLLEDHAAIVRDRVLQFCDDNNYDNLFWEEALYSNDNKMIVKANVVHLTDVVEINTYEQLRELDSASDNLKSDAIEVISKELHVLKDNIVDITVLKKGMTNRSFLFKCDGKRYIMRIPGEGTDRLINRSEEAAVYRVIGDRRICDDIVYINSDNGYKITAFLEGARVCNPFDIEDLKKCMSKLRWFHGLELTVDHNFDIFEQIEFYEKLWNGVSSYKDYKRTKYNIFSMKHYIDEHIEKRVLTHIDAVPDNFLLIGDDVRLIDWEYAGMQDPHVDIAMFCIYSLYNKRQIDRLINIYFDNECLIETRIKIYCYIASCGLLWSNWCEYKRSLGVEFGEYAVRQYRYAKDYYKVFKTEIARIGNNSDE
jgi:CTP:phosphocholine cytidylyltransferase-like protein/thiamine kinase-like enzyme